MQANQFWELSFSYSLLTLGDRRRLRHHCSPAASPQTPGSQVLLISCPFVLPFFRRDFSLGLSREARSQSPQDTPALVPCLSSGTPPRLRMVAGCMAVKGRGAKSVKERGVQAAEQRGHHVPASESRREVVQVMLNSPNEEL